VKAIVILILLFAGSKSSACDSDRDYEALLARYVTDGRVDYTAWHESAVDRKKLHAVVAELGRRKPSAMEPDAALAYWINLYNALTLQLILDHHPVDSIKDIGGFLSSPWKRELVQVEGEDLTLDEIENEIIRPTFEDARIHFALNCAAVSCPPLQSKPFCGDTLDAQLESATQAVVRDERFVDTSDCAEGEGELRLSKIFDWYHDDFRPRGLVEFVNGYLEQTLPAECDVEFMDYDWQLNGE